MIYHIKKNIGKKFLYILPVKPYPYNVIENYIVCIVEVVRVFNKFCSCKILDVINDTSFGLFKFYKSQNKDLFNCSNIYLFDFYK